MSNPTFHQDLKALVERHPRAGFVCVFLQYFALMAIGDALVDLHSDLSFRAHVGELAGRALFIVVVVWVVHPWFQKHRFFFLPTKPGI